MLIVVLLIGILVTPAAAQVHVDIGIHLPAPPRLVIVPEVRAVRYVPVGAANLFQYDGQYWAFTKGGWHVSHDYNGPWIVVAPQFVPRPILLVPVNYYRAPPGHWKQWDRRHPPRWSDDWGREWSQKRGWKNRDHDRRGHDRKEHARGRDDDRGKGRGKGHDKDDRRGHDKDDDKGGRGRGKN
jgi:hypothetical protein